MHEQKFEKGATVGGGTKLMLTWAQAEPRLHLLERLEPAPVDAVLADVAAARKKVGAARKTADQKAETEALVGLDAAREKLSTRSAYLVREPVFFKQGEVVGINGVLSRLEADAAGIPAEAQTAARKARAASRPAAKKANRR